jgi:hypothetical protein
MAAVENPSVGTVYHVNNFRIVDVVRTVTFRGGCWPKGDELRKARRLFVQE